MCLCAPRGEPAMKSGKDPSSDPVWIASAIGAPSREPAFQSTFWLGGPKGGSLGRFLGVLLAAWGALGSTRGFATLCGAAVGGRFHNRKPAFQSTFGLGSPEGALGGFWGRPGELWGAQAPCVANAPFSGISWRRFGRPIPQWKTCLPEYILAWGP